MRRGWGRSGQQLHSNNTFRLNRYNVIAAAASTGEVWFTVNNGYNTSQTIWAFILKLCLALQEADPDWRRHTVLQLDNAASHKS